MSPEAAIARWAMSVPFYLKADIGLTSGNGYANLISKTEERYSKSAVSSDISALNQDFLNSRSRSTSHERKEQKPFEDAFVLSDEPLSLPIDTQAMITGDDIGSSSGTSQHITNNALLGGQAVTSIAQPSSVDHLSEQKRDGVSDSMNIALNRISHSSSTPVSISPTTRVITDSSDRPNLISKLSESTSITQSPNRFSHPSFHTQTALPSASSSAPAQWQQTLTNSSETPSVDVLSHVRQSSTLSDGSKSNSNYPYRDSVSSTLAYVSTATTTAVSSDVHSLPHIIRMSTVPPPIFSSSQATTLTSSVEHFQPSTSYKISPGITTSPAGITASEEVDGIDSIAPVMFKRITGGGKTSSMNSIPCSSHADDASSSTVPSNPSYSSPTTKDFSIDHYQLRNLDPSHPSLAISKLESPLIPQSVERERFHTPTSRRTADDLETDPVLNTSENKLYTTHIPLHSNGTSLFPSNTDSGMTIISKAPENTPDTFKSNSFRHIEGFANNRDDASVTTQTKVVPTTNRGAMKPVSNTPQYASKKKYILESVSVKLTPTEQSSASNFFPEKSNEFSPTFRISAPNHLVTNILGEQEARLLPSDHSVAQPVSLYTTNYTSDQTRYISINSPSKSTNSYLNYSNPNTTQMHPSATVSTSSPPKNLNTSQTSNASYLFLYSSAKAQLHSSPIFNTHFTPSPNISSLHIPVTPLTSLPRPSAPQNSQPSSLEQKNKPLLRHLEAKRIGSTYVSSLVRSFWNVESRKIGVIQPSSYPEIRQKHNPSSPKIQSLHPYGHPFISSAPVPTNSTFIHQKYSSATETIRNSSKVSLTSDSQTSTSSRPSYSITYSALNIAQADLTHASESSHISSTSIPSAYIRIHLLPSTSANHAFRFQANNYPTSNSPCTSFAPLTFPAKYISSHTTKAHSPTPLTRDTPRSFQNQSTLSFQLLRFPSVVNGYSPRTSIPTFSAQSHSFSPQAVQKNSSQDSVPVENPWSSGKVTTLLPTYFTSPLSSTSVRPATFGFNSHIKLSAPKTQYSTNYTPSSRVSWIDLMKTTRSYPPTKAASTPSTAHPYSVGRSSTPPSTARVSLSSMNHTFLTTVSRLYPVSIAAASLSPYQGPVTSTMYPYSVYIRDSATSSSVKENIPLSFTSYPHVKKISWILPVRSTTAHSSPNSDLRSSTEHLPPPQLWSTANSVSPRANAPSPSASSTPSPLVSWTHTAKPTMIYSYPHTSSMPPVKHPYSLCGLSTTSSVSSKAYSHSSFTKYAPLPTVLSKFGIRSTAPYASFRLAAMISTRLPYSSYSWTRATSALPRKNISLSLINHPPTTRVPWPSKSTTAYSSYSTLTVSTANPHSPYILSTATLASPSTSVSLNPSNHTSSPKVLSTFAERPTTAYFPPHLTSSPSIKYPYSLYGSTTPISVPSKAYVSLSSVIYPSLTTTSWTYPERLTTAYFPPHLTSSPSIKYLYSLYGSTTPISVPSKAYVSLSSVIYPSLTTTSWTYPEHTTTVYSSPYLRSVVSTTHSYPPFLLSGTSPASKENVSLPSTTRPPATELSRAVPATATTIYPSYPAVKITHSRDIWTTTTSGHIRTNVPLDTTVFESSPRVSWTNPEISTTTYSFPHSTSTPSVKYHFSLNGVSKSTTVPSRSSVSLSSIIHAFPTTYSRTYSTRTTTAYPFPYLGTVVYTMHPYPPYILNRASPVLPKENVFLPPTIRPPAKEVLRAVPATTAATYPSSNPAVKIQHSHDVWSTTASGHINKSVPLDTTIFKSSPRASWTNPEISTTTYSFPHSTSTPSVKYNFSVNGVSKATTVPSRSSVSLSSINYTLPTTPLWTYSTRTTTAYPSSYLSPVVSTIHPYPPYISNGASPAPPKENVSLSSTSSPSVTEVSWSFSATAITTYPSSYSAMTTPDFSNIWSASTSGHSQATVPLGATVSTSSPSDLWTYPEKPTTTYSSPYATFTPSMKRPHSLGTSSLTTSVPSETHISSSYMNYTSLSSAPWTYPGRTSAYSSPYPGLLVSTTHPYSPYIWSRPTSVFPKENLSLPSTFNMPGTSGSLPHTMETPKTHSSSHPGSSTYLYATYGLQKNTSVSPSDPSWNISLVTSSSLPYAFLPGSATSQMPQVTNNAPSLMKSHQYTEIQNSSFDLSMIPTPGVWLIKTRHPSHFETLTPTQKIYSSTETPAKLLLPTPSIAERANLSTAMVANRSTASNSPKIDQNADSEALQKQNEVQMMDAYYFGDDPSTDDTFGETLVKFPAGSHEDKNLSDPKQPSKSEIASADQERLDSYEFADDSYDIQIEMQTKMHKPRENKRYERKRQLSAAKSCKEGAQCQPKTLKTVKSSRRIFNVEKTRQEGKFPTSKRRKNNSARRLTDSKWWRKFTRLSVTQSLREYVYRQYLSLTKNESIPVTDTDFEQTTYIPKMKEENERRT
ncbi:hypothetical protein AB6A40_003221 [Gnathostoma spinigerum]|uniref:Uncharacterized protein n=1 Tax=Gnathostoma spinigerum TaxID=75299 RepID=A0ABD6EB73_9BILA